MSNAECAKVFVDAIRKLAKKPENIDNLESYLSNHFDIWMKVFAGTPETLAFEMEQFAEMEI